MGSWLWVLCECMAKKRRRPPTSGPVPSFNPPARAPTLPIHRPLGLAIHSRPNPEGELPPPASPPDLAIHLLLFASFGVREPPSTFPGIAPRAAAAPPSSPALVLTPPALGLVSFRAP